MSLSSLHKRKEKNLFGYAQRATVEGNSRSQASLYFLGRTDISDPCSLLKQVPNCTEPAAEAGSPGRV